MQMIVKHKMNEFRLCETTMFSQPVSQSAKWYSRDFAEFIMCIHSEQNLKCNEKLKFNEIVRLKLSRGDRHSDITKNGILLQLSSAYHYNSCAANVCLCVFFCALCNGPLAFPFTINPVNFLCFTWSQLI